MMLFSSRSLLMDWINISRPRFPRDEVRTGNPRLRLLREHRYLVTFLLIMALLTASVGSMGLAGRWHECARAHARDWIMRSIGQWT